MLRLLALVAAFTIFFGVASAEVVDRGPPYTDAEFIAFSETRLPESFRKILPDCD